MKFTNTLLLLLATATTTTLATPIQDDVSSPAEHELFKLEKRRSCSGHRLPYEVCQGRLIAQMPSRHNCYRASGHCCALNSNRDGGVTVSNGSQKGEDCGYCFTGNCKVERH